MTAGNRISLSPKTGLAAMALLALLSGCATTKEALSVFDRTSPPTAVMPATAPAVTETGTVVGQRVMAIRGELQRLDDNIARHQSAVASARYALRNDRSAYEGVAGNLAAPPPGQAATAASMTRYGDAQGALDRVDDEVGALYVLSREGARDERMARRLGEEIKAAEAIPGGGDKDREQVAALQNAIATDATAIQQMNGEISRELAEEKGYVAGQRRRLAALGITAPEQRTQVATAAPRPPAELRQPLVTIRFDRRDVPFQHALYLAVSSALDRKPDLRFNVVAVSPSAGNAAQVAVNVNAARRNAGAVMRTLVAMGLPANRIEISATTSPGVHFGEVRVYVH
jgi:hypothetical protein